MQVYLSKILGQVANPNSNLTAFLTDQWRSRDSKTRETLSHWQIKYQLESRCSGTQIEVVFQHHRPPATLNTMAELNAILYNDQCYHRECLWENSVKARKELKSTEWHRASYSRILLHLTSNSCLCFLLPHAVLRTTRSHLVSHLLLSGIQVLFRQVILLFHLLQRALYKYTLYWKVHKWHAVYHKRIF